MDVNLAVWLLFGVAVVVMLALDLGVFNRTPHEVSHREAIVWTLLWVILAMLFNGVIWVWQGHEKAVQFLTGYVVEKALSLDNVFVFAVIFGHFAIPLKYQHRVLFYGVLGAIVMRGIFIILGVELIRHFDNIFYIFGLILIVGAIKMLVNKEEKSGDIRLPGFITRWLPATRELHGHKFLVKINGRWMMTPLLMILIAIEFSDVVFAVDSIPAIFAITQDPFLVYTSNIFAIMGLRSMYFLLAGSLSRFYYLRHGLSFILFYIGVKMLAMKHFSIPLWMSLMVILILLSGSIMASVIKDRTNNPSR